MGIRIRLLRSGVYEEQDVAEDTAQTFEALRDHVTLHLLEEGFSIIDPSKKAEAAFFNRGPRNAASRAKHHVGRTNIVQGKAYRSIRACASVLSSVGSKGGRS